MADLSTSMAWVRRTVSGNVEFVNVIVTLPRSVSENVEEHAQSCSPFLFSFLVLFSGLNLRAPGYQLSNHKI